MYITSKELNTKKKCNVSELKSNEEIIDHKTMGSAWEFRFVIAQKQE